MSEPTFTFCGKFNGKTESASRWLKSLDHELRSLRAAGTLTPVLHLQYIDLLLQGEAAEWAESNPEAIRILDTDDATQATVDQFTLLFKQRFPAKIVEVAPVTFDIELQDLRQQSAETITAYYMRTTTLMTKYSAKDRSTTLVLSLAESSLLDNLLRTWIRGLTDPSVKRKCAELMGNPDRSLRKLYDIAESTRRINIEIQKLFEDEVKDNELQFYKEIAQRNMPKTKIDALLASYHTKAHGHEQIWNHNGYSSYQPSPSYQSEPQSSTPAFPAPAPAAAPAPQAPLPLASNPSRANHGPPLQPAPQNRSRNYQQPFPKNLPDRKTSKNQWINGSKTYDYRADGRLCVKCGNLGHIPKDCVDEVLPAWEQSYLKEIVFGNPPQVSFTAAGFGEHDGTAQPYGSSSTKSSVIYTPSVSDSSAVASPVNSVHFGTAGLSGAESNAADAMIGEGSGPNKRAHVEDAESQTQQQSQQPYQFQAVDGRPKRKGQKKVGKKNEPQPLVGMFNETLGKYDSPVSIRQVLQNNKVDMTWMDLVAWSPAVCRELKRLCTRVAKKRVPKASTTKAQQAGAPQFNFQPVPQFPQPIPAYMMPAQAFQPTQAPIQAPQPMMSGALQQPQTGLGQAPNSQSASGSVSHITTTQAERHTRYLSAMIGVDKAFRIQAVIYKQDGTTVILERKHTQADQGSDMNVLSMGLVRFLGLELHSLTEVGFKGLSMRTADHRETVLEHWVWLRLSVEGVMRDIRCFVAPELPQTTVSGATEHLSLILGIPWLYSVDAQISIRHSRIMIGDSSVGEQVRAVTGPELVFCQDHNLLMYPKDSRPNLDTAEEDSSSDSSSDESDDVDDVDDPMPPFH